MLTVSALTKIFQGEGSLVSQFFSFKFRDRQPVYFIESLEYKRILTDSRHNLLLERNAAIRVYTEKRVMKIGSF